MSNKAETLTSEAPIVNWQLKVLLLAEIEKWSNTYEFSFQFWGESNNVWIYKGGVELFSAGGRKTPLDIMIDAMKYIYKINPRAKRIDLTKQEVKPIDHE